MPEKSRFQEMKLTIYKGDEVAQGLTLLSKLRTSLYAEFPYLYESDERVEEAYLDGFSTHGSAILLTLEDSFGLAAASCAVPLVSDIEILSECGSLYASLAIEPEKTFYYTDVLIAPRARGKGALRFFYSLQEEWAKKNGFSLAVLAAVVRDKSDPRRPEGYVDADLYWQRLGFVRTEACFSHAWPTRQRDGRVEEESNLMRFWVRRFET